MIFRNREYQLSAENNQYFEYSKSTLETRWVYKLSILLLLVYFNSNFWPFLMSDESTESTSILLFAAQVFVTVLWATILYRAWQDPASALDFFRRRCLHNVLFWTRVVSEVAQFDPELFLVGVKNDLVASLTIMRVELIACLTPFLDPIRKIIQSAYRCLSATVYLAFLLALTLLRNLALVFSVLIQTVLIECL